MTKDRKTTLFTISLYALCFTTLIIIIWLGSAHSYSKPIEGKIAELEYKVGTGSTANQLNIERMGSTIVLRHQVYDAQGLSVDNSGVITEDALEELNDIINEHKAYKWNGFTKIANDVTDGEGFELYIKYDSKFEGRNVIKAKGYMYFPDNYIGFQDDILNWLAKYIEVKR